MARPERPLDPEDNPVHAFAAALRAVREKAGDPTYLKMARQVGRSRTALAEAAGGDHLATWDTVEAYLHACGQRPEDWRPRWETLRRQLDQSKQPAPAPTAAEPPEPEEEPTAEPVRRRARWPWAALGAAGAVVLATPVVLLVRTSPPARATAAAPGVIYVTVQNKVASGTSGFYEDVSPEYLSTKPEPRCAHTGCKIPNTDMSSGAVLEALCQETGASITNEDLGSPGIAQNPNGVTSARWYLVEMPNGVQGLISEAYLTPASRGGLALPRCPFLTVASSSHSS